MADDQLYHDLEQRYLLLKNEKDAVGIERDALKGKLEHNEKVYSDLRTFCDNLQRDGVNKDSLINEKASQLAELTRLHEDTVSKLNRQSEDNDRLRDTLRQQSEELANTQANLRRAQSSLSDAEYQLLPLQTNNSKLTKERDLLKAQIEELENELKSKLAEVIGLRSNSLNERELLQQQLNSTKNDLHERSSALKVAEDRIALQNEKIDELINKLNTSEEANAEQQSSFLTELESLKKMIDLYKRLAEEATVKVEELETALAVTREKNGSVISKFKEQQQQMADAHAKEANALSNRIVELEQQLHQSLLSASLAATNNNDSVLATSTIAIDNSFEKQLQSELLGLGATEVYDRIATSERALVIERGRCKELELVLKRIVNEVESKTTAIQNQSRDFNRIVESHELLSNRLNKLAVENVQLKETIVKLEKQTKEAIDESESVRQSNSDLSAQLQHLLKVRFDEKYAKGQQPHLIESNDADSSTSNANAMDVISTYLLTFDDVKELQAKNAQLVQVVRKLSTEQEKYITVAQSEKQSTEDTADALNTAMRELIQMREARLQTQSMVDSLAQQRDMYKAMLEEANLAINALQGAPASTSAANTPAKQLQQQQTLSATPSVASMAVTPNKQTLNSPFATPSNVSHLNNSSSASTPNQSQQQQLMMQIAQTQEENRTLRERMLRLEEAERLFSDSLDATRAECNKLRIEAATSNSNLRFQRERADRLDESIKEIQSQNALLSQKRFELEKVISNYISELRLKDEKNNLFQLNSKKLEEEIRKYKIEIEVSKASEARLLTQLNELREEVKKQIAVSDSIRRIESNVSIRLEEEKNSLIIEKEFLKSNLENIRKESISKELIANQQIGQLNEDKRVLLASLDSTKEELNVLTIDLTRERGTSKAATERSNLLEKQLNHLNERLNQLQGTNVTTIALANDLSERENALEQAKATIESLELQLSLAKEHSEQYRKISTATETTLRELQLRSQQTKDIFDSEINKLKGTISQQSEEIAKSHSFTKDYENEIEKLHETIRSQAAEHNQTIKGLEEEIRITRQINETSISNIELLKAEIVKHQTTARQSHSNYERELQLHSEAETKIRLQSEEIEKLSNEITIEKAKNVDLSTNLVLLQQQFNDEKEQKKLLISENKAQIENYKQTNELLHSQLHSLTQQINKYNSVAEETSSENSSSSSLSLSEENKNKEIKELRELIRFIKTEKDIVETKLSVSESEVARNQTTIHSLQRLTDELKGQIKQLNSENSTNNSSNNLSSQQIQQILAENSQLKIVSESNSHLRSELEILLAKEKETLKNFEFVESQIIPLKDAIQRLTAEKEALEDANETLLNDSTYWKDRLHQLVSRYSDIDPEEHRLLQVKNEELKAKIDSLNEQLTVANTLAMEEKQKNTTEIEILQENANSIEKQSNEYRIALENKSKEFDALKVTNENIEKNANQLRERLRSVKPMLETRDKKIADAEAQVTKLTAEIESLQTQLTAATAAAAAAPKNAPVTTPVTNAGVKSQQGQQKPGPKVPLPPSGPPPNAAATAAATAASNTAPASTAAAGSTPSLSVAAPPSTAVGKGGVAGKGSASAAATPSTPTATATAPAATTPTTPATAAAAAAATATAPVAPVPAGQPPAPGPGVPARGAAGRVAGRVVAGRVGKVAPPPVGTTAAAPAVPTGAPPAPAGPAPTPAVAAMPVASPAPAAAPAPAAEASTEPAIVATGGAAPATGPVLQSSLDSMRQRLLESKRGATGATTAATAPARAAVPPPPSTRPPESAAPAPAPVVPAPVPAPVAAIEEEEEVVVDRNAKRMRVAAGAGDIPTAITAATATETAVPVKILQQTFESNLISAATASASAAAVTATAVTATVGTGLKRSLEESTGNTRNAEGAVEDDEDAPAAKMIHLAEDNEEDGTTDVDEAVVMSSSSSSSYNNNNNNNVDADDNSDNAEGNTAAEEGEVQEEEEEGEATGQQQEDQEAEGEAEEEDNEEIADANTNNGDEVASQIETERPVSAVSGSAAGGADDWTEQEDTTGAVGMDQEQEEGDHTNEDEDDLEEENAADAEHGEGEEADDAETAEANNEPATATVPSTVAAVEQGGPRSSPFLENLRPPSPAGAKPVFGDGKSSQAFPIVPFLIPPPNAAGASGITAPSTPTSSGQSLFGSIATTGSASAFSFGSLSSMSNSNSSGTPTASGNSIFRNTGIINLGGSSSSSTATSAAAAGAGAVSTASATPMAGTGVGGIFGVPKTGTAPRVMGTSIFGQSISTPTTIDSSNSKSIGLFGNTSSNSLFSTLSNTAGSSSSTGVEASTPGLFNRTPSSQQLTDIVEDNADSNEPASQSQTQPAATVAIISSTKTLSSEELLRRRQAKFNKGITSPAATAAAQPSTASAAAEEPIGETAAAAAAAAATAPVSAFTTVASTSTSAGNHGNHPPPPIRGKGGRRGGRGAGGRGAPPAGPPADA